MLAHTNRSLALRTNRTFVLSTTAALVGLFLYSENNVLANRMEKGQLHYPTPEAPVESPRSELWPRALPQYAGHVPLTTIEKTLMFLGLAAGAFMYPHQNQHIVALGELTAFPFVLRRLQRHMLGDAVGREILRERPRMTLLSLSLPYLRSLPSGTIGKTYVEWLDREKVSPDTREPVRYIDDAELAYIYQRYRECHDFYHAVTGLPVLLEGEIALKVFEFINIGMPMNGLGALMAPLRLGRQQKKRLYGTYYPWALRLGANAKPLINVYWEKILERDVVQFREEMGIEQPPDLRELRRKQMSKPAL